jgi:hypothetical protein
MRCCTLAFAALLFAPSMMKPALAATWGVGPLGGVNLSSAEVGSQESRGVVGWAVGARLEMGFNPLMALSLEPMLVRHSDQFDPPGGAYAGRAQLHTLEMPLFLKLRMGLANMAVNAFAGPNLTMMYDVNGRVASNRQLINNDFKPVGMAGDIGLGVAFDVAPLVEITADARYSHGFTDVMNSRTGDVDHWRTRDVRMIFGVLLNTGH